MVPYFTIPPSTDAPVVPTTNTPSTDAPIPSLLQLQLNCDVDGAFFYYPVSTSLNFTGCNIVSLDIFKPFLRLTYLNLYNNSKLEGSGLINLAFNQLKYLNVSGCPKFITMGELIDYSFNSLITLDARNLLRFSNTYVNQSFNNLIFLINKNIRVFGTIVYSSFGKLTFNNKVASSYSYSFKALSTDSLLYIASGDIIDSFNETDEFSSSSIQFFSNGSIINSFGNLKFIFADNLEYVCRDFINSSFTSVSVVYAPLLINFSLTEALNNSFQNAVIVATTISPQYWGAFNNITTTSVHKWHHANSIGRRNSRNSRSYRIFNIIYYFVNL